MVISIFNVILPVHPIGSSLIQPFAWSSILKMIYVVYCNVQFFSVYQYWPEIEYCCVNVSWFFVRFYDLQSWEERFFEIKIMLIEILMIMFKVMWLVLRLIIKSYCKLPGYTFKSIEESNPPKPPFPRCLNLNKYVSYCIS